MGGLTYLFGFIINSIVATFVAAFGALVVATLPVTKAPAGGAAQSKPKKGRAARAARAFITIWLLVSLYGCVSMFTPHTDDLSQLESARVVPGLIQSEAQVMAGQSISRGDTAQTYVVVSTAAEDVERITKMQNMKLSEFDAHTASARGWRVPDWWPNAPCEGGVTYHDDPFADPPSTANYTLSWCPQEQKAYVQRFDY